MVAYKIWGLSVAALKGKMVCKKPEPVKTETIHIPKEICELHKEATLMIDIFFYYSIPFFITLSQVLYFTMVMHLPDRSLGQIFKALNGIFYYYLQQGFRVTFIMGDGEFASLKQFTNLLMGAPCLNLTSANKDEPFIGHRIHVVKERVQSIQHLLPFSNNSQSHSDSHGILCGQAAQLFPGEGGCL